MKALVREIRCKKPKMAIIHPEEPKSAYCKLQIEVISTGKWETDEKGFLKEKEIRERLLGFFCKLLMEKGEQIEF